MNEIDRPHFKKIDLPSLPHTMFVDIDDPNHVIIGCTDGGQYECYNFASLNSEVYWEQTRNGRLL